MKIGDLVFIVPSEFQRAAGFLTPVWFSGTTRFSAGEQTFERATDGELFIGSHWKGAKVYESQEIFETMADRRDAWQKLRYIVMNNASPPHTASTDDLQAILKLLKGK